MPLIGGHRLPPLPNPPPPKRPVPPPPRPKSSVPVDTDEQLVPEFADHFDAIPLPDMGEATAEAPVCNYQNMEYIRSYLPISVHFKFQDFFDRMAKHQWRGARANAALPRLMSMATHRPTTAVDKSKPLYGKAATGWDKIKGLERVNAYVFRGEKRPPKEIRAADGFHPPSSRTDDRYVPVIAMRFVEYMKERFNKVVDPKEVEQYIKGQGAAGKVFVEYEIWRAILESEQFHIGRMVADEFLRGFISTSRDVRMAWDFCKQKSADRYRAKSYGLYALHTEGGFLLPPIAQHVHGTKAQEAEIAHPGPIPWLKVMAFRTGRDVDFFDPGTHYKSKVIFVRKGFRQADPKGSAQVIATLGSLPPM